MDACLLIVELTGQMDPPLPHPPSISISALCTNIHNGNALIKKWKRKDYREEACSAKRDGNPSHERACVVYSTFFYPAIPTTYILM